MQISILSFFTLLCLNVFSQDAFTLKPISKESKTYIADRWNQENFYESSFYIEVFDEWKTLKMTLTEPNKKVIFNLRGSANATKWNTDEGYEFIIRYFRGEDGTGKTWNVEFYVPQKGITTPFIVLKDERIIIRYKFAK